MVDHIGKIHFIGIRGIMILGTGIHGIGGHGQDQDYMLVFLTVGGIHIGILGEGMVGVAILMYRLIIGTIPPIIGDILIHRDISIRIKTITSDNGIGVPVPQLARLPGEVVDQKVILMLVQLAIEEQRPEQLQLYVLLKTIKARLCAVIPTIRRELQDWPKTRHQDVAFAPAKTKQLLKERAQKRVLPTLEKATLHLPKSINQVQAPEEVHPNPIPLEVVAQIGKALEQLRDRAVVLVAVVQDPTNQEGVQVAAAVRDHR